MPSSIRLGRGSAAIRFMTAITAWACMSACTPDPTLSGDIDGGPPDDDALPAPDAPPPPLPSPVPPPLPPESVEQVEPVEAPEPVAPGSHGGLSERCIGYEWCTWECYDQACVKACAHTHGQDAADAWHAMDACLQALWSGPDSGHALDLYAECGDVLASCLGAQYTVDMACGDVCSEYVWSCGAGRSGEASRQLVMRGVSQRFRTRGEQATLRLRAVIDPATLPGVVAVHETAGPKGRADDWVRVDLADVEAVGYLRTHPAVAAVYPAVVGPDGRVRRQTDRLLVRLDGDPRAFARAHGLRHVESLSLEGVHAFTLAAGQRDPLHVAARIADADGVRWAQPDFVHQVARRQERDPGAPGGRPIELIEPGEPPERLEHRPDGALRAQWHLGGGRSTPDRVDGLHVRARDAWRLERGRPEVAIAVLDDGIDEHHPVFRWGPLVEPGELPGRPGDFDALVTEGYAVHGTAVAAVAAGTGGDGLPQGVCPGCSVMPLWSHLVYGEMSDTDLVRTFTTVRDSGVGVMNNSWGLRGGDPDLIEPDVPDIPGLIGSAVFEAVLSAVSEGRDGRGVAIVFSAGNNNEDIDSDPLARHPATLTVAALNGEGIKADYSDFGAVWITAPSAGDRRGGPGVVTADLSGRDHGYGDAEGLALDPGGRITARFGGTSAAAPMVSGTIGLMLSANPDLEVSQVFDILRRTARPIDIARGRYVPDGDGTMWSPYYGYGLLDTRAAVRAAIVGCASPAGCPPADPAAVADRLAFAVDGCGGGDDDLDGRVDEDADCRPLDGCAPCDLERPCDGACAVLPGTQRPVCLPTCEADDDCDASMRCAGGMCAPRSGRCEPAAPEVCNDVDDDLDGQVDEGTVCQTGWTGGCVIDSNCAADEVCYWGWCTPTCEDDEACGRSMACMARADGYGDPLPGRICAPWASWDADPAAWADCLARCGEDHGTVEGIGALAECVVETETCGEFDACLTP